jgi:hypothetical protein
VRAAAQTVASSTCVKGSPCLCPAAVCIAEAQLLPGCAAPTYLGGLARASLSNDDEYLVFSNQLNQPLPSRPRRQLLPLLVQAPPAGSTGLQVAPSACSGRLSRLLEGTPAAPCTPSGLSVCRLATCRRWRRAEATSCSHMPSDYLLAARSSCSPANAGACMLAAPITPCQAAQACRCCGGDADCYNVSGDMGGRHCGRSTSNVHLAPPAHAVGGAPCRACVSRLLNLLLAHEKYSGP